MENGQRKEEEATKSCDQKVALSFVDEYVSSEAKYVTTWLTKEEPARSVLSLVGPARIGKTTLAKKVYESKMVQDHFDACYWVNVSGPYKIEDLRKIIAKKISLAVQNEVGLLDVMLAKDLIGALRQSLQAKRYMVVFDGVSHEKFWDLMKHSLPNNDKGSRIIITTANDRVVVDLVHELRPLSDTRSFELFCRIAFHEEPEPHCPAELDVISREIVGLCKGFPFPIVCVAGLLSKKEKLVSEWQKVCYSLKIEVKTNIEPLGFLEVLALSFYDLPSHLKQCFLYFSLFPEESVISNDKLFKLWIAEGFIEGKTPGRPLEHVAEEYLTELTHRGLVQPCQGFYRSLGRFCQIDKLIHKIAIAKADELEFGRVWNGKISRSRRKCRRVSVYNVACVSGTIEDHRTRSVFLYNVRALHPLFLSTLMANCEFLTLLDFEDCPIENLPEELGNLFHLKYLGLKNTLVSKLPMSLHKLQNLETLNLSNTLLRLLPIQIYSLGNLQHLLASVYAKGIGRDSTKGVRIGKGIEHLTNLQTLINVELNHINGIALLEVLAKLRNLRKLGISGLTSELASSLSTCIDELSHLESLTLQANCDEVLNLRCISSQTTLLQRLVLKGRLASLPNGISSLRNLSALCLSLSHLKDDPLRHLSQLPNLASLWLYRGYEGEKLHFEKYGFKRLKLLVIRELRGLRVVEIDRGALAALEELRIGPSPRLNEVPVGIFHLRSLKVLSNYNMSREFVLGMRPNEGSDYWKVEHVTSVLFWYRIPGRSYKLFKLGDSDLLCHLRGLATNSGIFEKKKYDLESSFCDSDLEEDDVVGELASLSRTQSTVSEKNSKQCSFSSGFYTDDVEE